VVQKKDLLVRVALKRALTLLKATADFIENNPVADYTVFYDNTDCDGECLKTDCYIVVEMIQEALAKIDGKAK
jgi:hypothetical protein